MEFMVNDAVNDPIAAKDPAQCAYTHFQSPVATLLKSRQRDDSTPCKDLSQAYGLFYAQTKSIATALSTRHPFDCPALEYLKPYASELTSCIKRDMELALVDVATRSREWAGHGQLDSAFYSAGVSEDNFKNFKDMADTSQHALQFVSCIFSLSALASVFSGMCAIDESQSICS